MLGIELSDDYKVHPLFESLLSKVSEGSGSVKFTKYQQDPVGFGQEVLGETFTDDVVKMLESVRDNQITIAKSANATGKTHAAARVAPWFFKSFPGSQIYTAAAPPESNLKKLLWGELNSVIEKHPELFKNDTLRTLHLEQSAQSFITGVTIPSSGTAAVREAKFSGKHAPYLLFIIDEGDAVPDEVYTGIESCMSGGHARLLIMYNPRSKAGEVYRMTRDGRANVVTLSAFNHPNVIEGRDVIPGAVTRSKTIQRIHKWCRPLTEYDEITADCFKLPSYLAAQTTIDAKGGLYPALKPGYFKVMEPLFSYMVLGEYPAQGSSQLISEEWITAARARYDAYVLENGEAIPKTTTGIMGLDVGEFGSDPSMICKRYGGHVTPFISWTGVDPTVTAERAAAEFRGKGLSWVSVDAIGVGSGVAPAMKKAGVNAFSVKVSESPTEMPEDEDMGQFRKLRDQLAWSIREWLRCDPSAMLPPDEELIEELLSVTYKEKDGYLIVLDKDSMRDVLKRSPNKLDALGLTFWKPDLLFPDI